MKRALAVLSLVIAFTATGAMLKRSNGRVDAHSAPGISANAAAVGAALPTEAAGWIPFYDNGAGSVVFAIDAKGNAMNPSIVAGDVIFVDDAAYRLRPPARGDVILIFPLVQSETPYISRVVGLPGETVTIENGSVFIDGRRLDEPYLNGAVTECNSRACGPSVIPDGHVFVLGDNRPSSADSRIFGPVDASAIFGKAWFVFDPAGARALESPVYPSAESGP